MKHASNVIDLRATCFLRGKSALFTEFIFISKFQGLWNPKIKIGLNSFLVRIFLYFVWNFRCLGNVRKYIFLICTVLIFLLKYRFDFSKNWFFFFQKKNPPCTPSVPPLLQVWIPTYHEITCMRAHDSNLPIRHF